MIPRCTIAFLLLSSACADRRTEPEAPRVPLGTTHVPPGARPDPEPPLAEVPPVVQQLVESVDALGERGRRDHTDVIAALDDLSEALAVVQPDPMRRARMRAAIDQLRASPETSLSHADYVRNALEEAVDIAREGSPRSQVYAAAFSTALVDLGAAVAAIDPDAPLLAQHARVVTALRAAASALHVALGLPPPRFGRPIEA